MSIQNLDALLDKSCQHSTIDHMPIDFLQILITTTKNFLSDSLNLVNKLSP